MRSVITRQEYEEKLKRGITQVRAGRPWHRQIDVEVGTHGRGNESSPTSATRSSGH